jgi:hypothetical protein
MICVKRVSGAAQGKGLGRTSYAQGTGVPQFTQGVTGGLGKVGIWVFEAENRFPALATETECFPFQFQGCMEDCIYMRRALCRS